MYVDVLVGTSHLAGDTTPARGAASSRVEVEDLVASWSPILGLTPMRSPAARFSDAVRSPVAFAMAATAATLVLTSSSCEQAREVVSVLLSPKARRDAVTGANARSLSWNLIRALDDPTKARRPAAARSIRIGTARYRSDGTERWPLDGSRLPARAWPSLRAASPWADANPYIGLVVSAALLRIATNLTTTEACRQLNHEHLGPRTARELGPLLGRTPGSGHDHFEELVRLHDAISTAAVPIDYTRRRHTFRAPTPIPERTARRIARELGLRPTPRLRTFMSWWIHEALSGNDVLLSESCLHLPGPLRHAYARQRSEWESDPPPLMVRRAEHALLVNRLDEPITWAPAYGTDGCWTCPPPQLDRTLDGWANRSLRGARRSVSHDLDRLPLSGRVAFAMSDQSWETRRLAVLMARFKMVVDVGTITQTANLIGVRQPTLSVAMRSLERQVGVTLLERSRHGFTLTPQGRQLHQLITESPLAHVDPAVRLNGPVISTSTNGAPSPGGERERPRIPATP
ncbi:LysR family transcriptional regulator [Nocardioides ginsengisoli]|uniref:LysR family transcriptional regulator n=1 Tax=Nocardioides ginsengisoli TaxID=363868 RepID=A0ABW3W8B6_9ACTN